MQKDSFEMTDADTEAVRRAVSETIEDMSVITHGTDTMTNTAKGAIFQTRQSLSPAPSALHYLKTPTLCSILTRLLRQFKLSRLVFTSL